MRRRTIRYSLLGFNVLLLLGVAGFMFRSSQGQTLEGVTGLTASTNAVLANPLDQLSSADIAVSVARMTSLPEATAVINQADSVTTQLTLTPTSSTVASKPQVLATAIKSRHDIQTYVTQAGDTVSGIAAKFNITSNSIRWSNGLLTTGDSIKVGTQLTIPPVNGIVYTVKAGDTPDNLATKYNADKQKIIAYNDAEVSGLQPGEQIIIPDAAQPVNRSPISSAAFTGFAWGTGPLYGGNGYDYGYCTYWAALRRQQIGRPLPTNLGDAWSWKYRAPSAGLGEGTTPQPGAVIWFNKAYPGHVAFVESVGPDGTVHMSEMNTIGWNRVDYRDIPANEAGGYTYIY